MYITYRNNKKYVPQRKLKVVKFALCVFLLGLMSTFTLSSACWKNFDGERLFHNSQIPPRFVSAPPGGSSKQSLLDDE